MWKKNNDLMENGDEFIEEDINQNKDEQQIYPFTNMWFLSENTLEQSTPVFIPVPLTDINNDDDEDDGATRE